ncbi:hypothetical protein [Hymenobacter sp. BT491]|uniref:hypothetical protein n=1 Tax=Hymenobacter sp. BT491 TaxID=2766779 RepID=UPI0016536FD5|nr:hypothetical protein [Hymenobacter sp. BT491]MBC6988211.1 hypothetical protein [Hymenobacter sp. BT491]
MQKAYRLGFVGVGQVQGTAGWKRAKLNFFYLHGFGLALRIGYAKVEYSLRRNTKESTTKHLASTNTWFFCLASS